MTELKIPKKANQAVASLVEGLKVIYQSNLVSIIAYGSAVTGGFAPKRSRVDLLVILQDASLESLKKAHAIVKKNTFCHLLFFNEEFIAKSLDTFPIEFLDIKEGYLVLFGKDILQDKVIETANLRFQCEAELKEKLIALKQQYIKTCRDPKAMQQLLLVSFSSILHILKSSLRLNGQETPRAKEEIIKVCGLRFGLDTALWNRLLLFKNGQTRIIKGEIEPLFVSFVRDLEKISDKIDAL
ncbi:MAG: hypothetical protein NT033_02690 [Candidatus Omnitrophica bacterium]|nr:hypothetical protein [Candidatus Omnitrophota bacterium]